MSSVLPTPSIDPGRQLVTSIINQLQLYLWESQDSVKRLCIPHPDYEIDENYIAFTHECANLTSVYYSICQRYGNEILQALSSSEVDYFLTTILGKLERYMSNCQNFARENLCHYTSDYSSTGDVKNLENFCAVLKIKPEIVLKGLEVFYEKANVRIREYMNDRKTKECSKEASSGVYPVTYEDNKDGGICFSKFSRDAKEFAKFYCKIVRYTQAATSYIRICRFALERFNHGGDFGACEVLLNVYYSDQIMLKLNDYSGESKMETANDLQQGAD
ncbi:hypothetical protein H4219_004223 [Mycoemilia scoparia]|uniref:Uncharacterized protein n=1 Tax=Mycoemilia scoparia TaxID=417184 RepID=A0A9W8DLT0_9FUNG|nr:hypothetical protein H4219_004223 [Mycoemilia scoparia]